MPLRSVCVFCGSRPGRNPAHAAAAQATGAMLARNGWRLVFGAGDVGLMGEVAKAAMAAGAPTLGVIPVHLLGRERQARLPIEEASITMRHLYDEFACFCTPDLLQNSIDIVQARLTERRAKGKPDVELLPLPPQAIKAEEPRMAIGGRKRRVARRGAFERMGMGEGSSFKNGFKACKRPYLATFITVSPALLAQ